MSGEEHTNNDPAQISKLNEFSAGCTNEQVESYTNNEQCDFAGSKSVLNPFYDSSGDKLPGYSNAIVGDGGYGSGGDITNWDVGQCFGDDLNSVQTVGEVFDIFGTGFEGSEQPGMGNTIGNHHAAGQEDHCNVVLTEQMPVSGGENMCCEPVEDGSNGTHTGEKIQGKIGTKVEEPHGNSCHDASNYGDEVSKCSDDMIGEENLSVREVANDAFESAVVGGWKLIDEVARQSVETAGCIPIDCDQNMLSHESETGEPSRIVNDVECVKSETVIPGGVIPNSVKSDITGDSLNPEDKVVELSSGPLENSSKSDYGKHDEPIDASDVVLDDVRVFETPKDQEEGLAVSVRGEQIEQKENATLDAEHDSACKQQTCVAEPAGESHDDIGKHSGETVKGASTAGDDNKASLDEQSRQSLEKVREEKHAIVLGLPFSDPSKPHRVRTPAYAIEASEKPRRGRRPRVASAAAAAAATSAASSRVLRPKLKEDPNTPESTSNLLNTQVSSVERRGRKMGQIKGKSDDEFSKMRKQLRYLLHKISYEQNLLDAYSNEGWRGQSLEKVRPEKELQRAKADINRFKVKIRELFHQLETMSCEGKFPESLYDSEGLIDSEDIFCAKCGSKDLPAGNDIILCDGSCDRGFHQYCLDPPLRTEEIPPGDEGWFCPACDCKFDCVDLLNESQGVKLTIEDSWEKVFPEAVAAIAGLKQDDLMGLPSDDSDDNDYDPDGQDDGSKEEGKEISSGKSDSDESDSSDSSDFSSASEDLGAVRNKDDQYLGLPSDDSEDEDFNPDAANSNDDEEDLGATIGNDETSENGHSLPAVVDEDLGDSLPLSGKRNIERLDYKKLFDETYGNDVSDSSDDEEWADDDATTRKKTAAKREVPVSADEDKLAAADGASPGVIAPQRRGRPKRVQQVENGSPDELQKTPQETSSGGKKGKRPPYNKLPESATKRLYESFKEQMYPDRSTKEKLAKELGLTPLRVDKWFGNARWSFHHHPSRVEACIARVVPGGGTPQTVAPADTNITVQERGEASSSKSDKGGDSKRKATVNSKDNETQAHDSSETPESLGRGQRKRRKSDAGRS